MDSTKPHSHRTDCEIERFDLKIFLQTPTSTPNGLLMTCLKCSKWSTSITIQIWTNKMRSMYSKVRSSKPLLDVGFVYYAEIYVCIRYMDILANISWVCLEQRACLMCAALFL